MTDEERAILDDLYSQGIIDNALRQPERVFVIDPAWEISPVVSELLEAVLQGIQRKNADILAARQAAIEAIESVESNTPLLQHFIDLLGVLEQISIDEGLV